MSTKRLTRSRDNRMLAGVCGGLGEYLGIDPTLVRLAFALFFVAGFGSSALLYVIMWLIVPLEGQAEATPTETIEAGVQEITEQARKIGSKIGQQFAQKGGGQAGDTAQTQGDQEGNGGGI